MKSPIDGNSNKINQNNRVEEEDQIEDEVDQELIEDEHEESGAIEDFYGDSTMNDKQH